MINCSPYGRWVQTAGYGRCWPGPWLLKWEAFRTFPSLNAHRLGVNIIVNGELREAPAPITVAQLLSELKLPERGVAVEVNLQIVPRTQHAQHQLHEGDRLEVVSLVGGG